ncbi:MAG: helix-turn-helix transcriptional regulator [Clostridia bacterium]|jgi:transcriptional regulator with XRE-family HTH domain|nr:helix-turn-helix transcriptional regulator [Clostridia bacterium]
MRSVKEKLLENDFGAYLYDLRCKKEYTIEELVEKIGMDNVRLKNIRKWEHDLEFPNLDQMYKLSEIYKVPIEVLMQVRTQTLEEGLKGVHKELIRLLSYILGFSIYGMLILCYIIIFATFIYAIWFFIDATETVRQNSGIS